jgi:hypothetical protein
MEVDQTASHQCCLLELGLRKAVPAERSRIRSARAPTFAIPLLALLVPRHLNATETEYYRRLATSLALEPERDCIRVRLAPERRIRNAQSRDVPLYLLHSAKIFHATPGGPEAPSHRARSQSPHEHSCHGWSEHCDRDTDSTDKSMTNLARLVAEFSLFRSRTWSGGRLS